MMMIMGAIEGLDFSFERSADDFAAFTFYKNTQVLSSICAL